jgi:hypothetical protein
MKRKKAKKEKQTPKRRNPRQGRPRPLPPPRPPSAFSYPLFFPLFSPLEIQANLASSPVLSLLDIGPKLTTTFSTDDRDDEPGAGIASDSGTILHRRRPRYCSPLPPPCMGLFSSFPPSLPLSRVICQRI